MGSGFSACTGPTSVGVTNADPKGKQALNHSGGGVHSDSCDSGISINESHRKSKTSRHNATSRQPAPDPDSEEEAAELAMVAGTDVACGTADFLMTSTPRAGVGPGGRMTMDDVAERSGCGSGSPTRAGALSPNGVPLTTRGPHSRPNANSLRHNPHSAPNLLDHAIHEVDEEVNDGEPEDKRLRPARPKSAHFRKSRAGQMSQRGRGGTQSRQKQRHLNSAGSMSGGEEGESPAEDMTSDEGEDDFDSDILSIPDETSCATRPDTLTTVKLGPQFHAKTKIHDSSKRPNNVHANDTSNDDIDWWTEDEEGGLSSRTKRDGSFRSQAGSSLTMRSGSRLWLEGRVAKKASERSISSILLTSAVELDAASPASAATNPACFAVTNPEITQHILKVSPSAQHTATIAACMHNVFNATAVTAESVASANEQVSREFFQNLTSQANRNTLKQKLQQLFQVKPASKREEAKTPEQELEKKLRDLFMVKDVGDKTADEKLTDKLAELDAASSEESDGSRSPRRRNGRRQTLVISSGITESLKHCNKSKALKSVLSSSNSESAINLEPDTDAKLKKRVSFSPDIPDVYKCSKTYRLRQIASIAKRLRRKNMILPMGVVHDAVAPPLAAMKSRLTVLKPVRTCLQEIEQELRAATLTLCAKEEVTRDDYCHAVMSLRPRFLRLLGDFKMASGEVLGRLPLDCQHIIQLEKYFAQRVMEMAGELGGLRELGPLVTQHLQDLEQLCEREAYLPSRPIRPMVMPANRKQALWDESGVEDESDSMEEDIQGSGANEFAEPLPLDCNGEARSHSHVSKAAGEKQSPALLSLPPRASCKSARPVSLASSMSSSRARSSARRPTGDVHTVLEADEGSIAGSSTAASNITTTTTVNSSTASRCSTSKGGCKSRPDSGIVVSSCSASYSSSEATRETDADLATQTEWIATSLDMLEQILQVRTESHETVKSLVDAITQGSTSDQLKAHALYRWLASQSMTYYAKCKTAKPNSPTGKLRQLAEGKICYAVLYQEMAKAAGLKCEKIDGYAKGPDYRPGMPVGGSGSNSNQFKHSWNAVHLDGHYHFLDAGFGALPCKFFVEHFFMTPPDEMRLSHFPKDKRWLLMTQSLSTHDFEGTLKTWPTMFAFNIRPLNMKSSLRSYDGRLSITVLLRNVAVSPQLEYVGPGPPQDADSLAFNIDQEIRNMDNAETFHLNLPEEGTYYFTLMVHDLEEDEDIPAFQYKVEYKDELL